MVVTETPDVVAKGPERARESQADLDPLLDLGTIWKTTADDFEKKYVAYSETTQGAEAPQFEWVKMPMSIVISKSFAQFSSRSNTSAKAPARLTLFGGAITVQDAMVNFRKGVVAQTTIGIYREDAGPMARPDFQALIKKVGQSVGGILKVTPRREFRSGPQTGSKNVVWFWTAPQGTAMLEHNDYEGQGASGKPEYLRLALMAPGQSK